MASENPAAGVHRSVPFRIWAMAERNLTFLRGSSYGWVVLASVAESLLLLVGFVWGFGGSLADVPVSATHRVPYADFVVPALVAVAAMEAAWAENLFTFFGKLTFARIYRPILHTPMSPLDIAAGELLTGALRVVLQLGILLSLVRLLGFTRLSCALGLLAVGLTVGVVFALLGMALATFLRTWEDFDVVATAQFVSVVLSGAFFPIAVLPGWLQAVARVTPLYHAVQVMRGVCLSGVPVTRSVLVLACYAVAAVLLVRRRVVRVLPLH